MKHFIYFNLFFFIVFAALQNAQGQTIPLQGRVFDLANRYPLDGVSVFCTCGKTTITDSAGNFQLMVSLKDSIWFSYGEKNTQKYPVDTIQNFSNFEIALLVDVRWLPEVVVRHRNYTLDSIQNRKDYAKVFNYKKPSLRLSSTPSYVPGSLTVGFDLDEIINMFRFRRNRQMLAFQKRLIEEERDKYIYHRFSKQFIEQLTGLQSPELEIFMLEYKPSYELLQQLNDLELGYYIQKCFALHQQQQKQKTDSLPANQ